MKFKKSPSTNPVKWIFLTIILIIIVVSNHQPALTNTKILQRSQSNQTQQQDWLEQCIHNQLYITLQGSFTSEGGFVFEKPPEITNEQMEIAGLSPILFGKWWSPTLSSVDIQMKDLTSAL